jgi:hypothetical protein
MSSICHLFVTTGNWPPAAARAVACNRASCGASYRHAHPNRLPPLRSRRRHRRLASARAHLLPVRARRAYQERQPGELPDRRAGRRCRARPRRTLARGTRPPGNERRLPKTFAAVSWTCRKKNPEQFSAQGLARKLLASFCLGLWPGGSRGGGGSGRSAEPNVVCRRQSARHKRCLSLRGICSFSV